MDCLHKSVLAAEVVHSLLMKNSARFLLSSGVIVRKHSYCVQSLLCDNGDDKGNDDGMMKMRDDDGHDEDDDCSKMMMMMLLMISYD
jgi:hypothetical protein